MPPTVSPRSASTVKCWRKPEDRVQEGEVLDHRPGAQTGRAGVVHSRLDLGSDDARPLRPAEPREEVLVQIGLVRGQRRRIQMLCRGPVVLGDVVGEGDLSPRPVGDGTPSASFSKLSAARSASRLVE